MSAKNLNSFFMDSEKQKYILLSDLKLFFDTENYSKNILIYYSLYKTSTLYSQILFSHLGVICFFLIITLGSPDQVLLDGATFSLPLIGGKISFNAILNMAPIMTGGLWCYLIIYYNHYRKIITNMKLYNLPRPNIITPLNHSILRWISYLSMYFITPFTFFAMLWKSSIYSKTYIYLLLSAIISFTSNLIALFYFHCKKTNIKNFSCFAILGVAIFLTFSVFVKPVFFCKITACYEKLLNRKLDLSYSNLQNSILIKKDFSYTNMKFSDLRGAKLIGANLQGANLTGANLYRASLSDANLEGADLTNVNLQNADLYSANLKNAVLLRSTLVNANLKNANLEGAILIESNAQGADFKRCNLEKANLSEANFKETRLSYAKLKNAYLKNTNLKNAKLEGVNLKLVKNIADIIR